MEDRQLDLLTWTRDGGQVIFAAQPGDEVSILTGQGDISRGKPGRLLYDVSWLWLPYLAPEGSRLMFSLPVQTGGSMLWTREGKDFTRAEMRREGFDPVWAPTGDRIVFGSREVEGRKRISF